MRDGAMKPINLKILTLEYCLVSFGYYVATCGVFGFATVLLLGKGFDAFTIGIIVCITNILSVLLAPAVARIADSSKTLTVHGILLRLYAVPIISSALLIVFGDNLILAAIFFTAMSTFVKGLGSMVNSVGVYYINKGVKIDFGIPRSLGTLSYALSSLALGYLCKYFGENSILVALIIGIVLSGAGIVFMPILRGGKAEADAADGTADGSADGDEKTVKAAKKDTRDSGGIFGFVKRYPRFCIVFAGLTLIFVYHNLIEGYMIQIMEQFGGDSSHQGIALTVAALAEFFPMMAFTWIHNRISSKNMILIGSWFYVIRGAIYLFATMIFHVYVAQFFQAFSYALIIPASVFYANEEMQEGDTFMGQALMAAELTTGGIFASVLGGYLVETFGVRTLIVVAFASALAGALVVTAAIAGKKKH